MSETIEQSAKRAWIEVATLREQVKKLTEECVVLRASNKTKLDTIAYLETREDENQQKIQTLTKERDSLTHTLEHMEHTRDVEQTRHREMSVWMRKQLAALAEQNEKFRKALSSACDHIELPYEIGERCAYRKPLSLPDLASPVLNRIRAEALNKAAKWFNDNVDNRTDTWQAQELRRMAAELEKTNG